MSSVCPPCDIVLYWSTRVSYYCTLVSYQVCTYDPPYAVAYSYTYTYSTLVLGTNRESWRCCYWYQVVPGRTERITHAPVLYKLLVVGVIQYSTPSTRYREKPRQANPVEIHSFDFQPVPAFGATFQSWRATETFFCHMYPPNPNSHYFSLMNTIKRPKAENLSTSLAKSSRP